MQRSTRHGPAHKKHLLNSFMFKSAIIMINKAEIAFVSTTILKRTGFNLKPQFESLLSQDKSQVR